MIIDVNTIYGFNPREAMDMSLERIKNYADSYGIKVCTLSNKGIAYNDREGNDETYTACSNDANLIPVATVDIRKYIHYKEEIKRCIDMGFKLFRLFPEFQGWGMESIAFRSIVEELALYDTVLIIKAPVADLYRAIGDIGLPTIVLDLRYYDLAEAIAVFEKAQNFYGEARKLIVGPDATNIFDSYIGTERLIFGTNFPYDHFENPYRLISEAEITQEQKQDIFSKNLIRLMGGVE